MNRILLSIIALVGISTFSAAALGSEAPSTPAPQSSTPSPQPATTLTKAPASASSADLNKQVDAVVAKIVAKLQKGERTETGLAPELAEFDAIIAAHKDDKSDAMAQTVYKKAVLYYQFFNEPEKFLDMCKQIVQDYPGTNTAKQVAAILPQLEPQVKMLAANQAIKAGLEVGKQFPEFAVSSGPVKDIDGKELSLAQYRGKIVLVDFWATWCGPCMGEMPNVVAAYQKYHNRGFEIVGVSLDHQEAIAGLPTFLAQHNMPWRQFCDGKYWQNELAVKYGIDSIPASFLLDGSGKIVAVSPRGPALEPAIEAALAAAGTNKI